MQSKQEAPIVTHCKSKLILSNWHKVHRRHIASSRCLFLRVFRITKSFFDLNEESLGILQRIQWRIQDFPDGRGARAPTYYLAKFVPENYMKMKEIELRGRQASLAPPLRSSNERAHFFILSMSVLRSRLLLISLFTEDFFVCECKCGARAYVWERARSRRYGAGRGWTVVEGPFWV